MESPVFTCDESGRISLEDGERLAGAISRMVRALVPGDFTNVTFWNERRQWRILHQHPADLEYPEPPFPEIFFELDPFYLAYREGRSGSLSLYELAPAGFRRSAYYREFYLDYGFSDALVHLTRLREGVTVWVEMGRASEREGFTRAERELHKAMFPAVEVLSMHLPELVWTAGERLPQLNEAELQSAFEHFGEGCLTERESAVIRLVLRGHNTRSVASQLEIAPDTAKLHRKHAYAKLRVSSQGELFFQFLQSLESRRPPLTDAPPAISPS
jgi:DNA-binding CsgD family transcriptional regulator